MLTLRLRSRLTRGYSMHYGGTTDEFYRVRMHLSRPRIRERLDSILLLLTLLLFLQL